MILFMPIIYLNKLRLILLKNLLRKNSIEQLVTMKLHHQNHQWNPVVERNSIGVEIEKRKPILHQKRKKHHQFMYQYQRFLMTPRRIVITKVPMIVTSRKLALPEITRRNTKSFSGNRES